MGYDHQLAVALDAASEPIDASSAPDGGAPTVVDAAPLAAKRIFLTSGLFSGNLGGLAGADARCQELAVKAGLDGSFRAWLSDSTGSPATRMTRHPGPYVATTGEVVATSWDDLTDGTLLAPIRNDENGQPITPVFVCVEEGAIWTNTTAQGYAAGDADCEDWTTNEIRTTAWGSGMPAATDASWTSSPCVNITCIAELPLYCVEQ